MHPLLTFPADNEGYRVQINKVNAMLQFGAYCVSSQASHQRDVVSMLLLHAGAGTAHAASPQHCAVLRSLLGAQQHVLCHRAHEGDTYSCSRPVLAHVVHSASM